MKEWLRLWCSFGYALQGINHAVRTQRNMQIHVAVALGVVILSIWLQVTRLELSLLLLVIAIVWALELLNTAIEACVDLVTKEYHPQAKIAKDVAAGAVFVSAMFAIVIGILILGPPLYAYFFTR
ncbi:diacylglycerol kinase family protein [Brevibacillus laterosporus]|uniref:Diacylglycerol kinase family protein n=1 Tax=Brevibacillus halotolerans TaxID=1507437 RepID=A0ABT4I4X1_9BACL|nr:diacylglycerol kinase family protein [Brevibacillus laterosporus]MCR8987857.1 diacylglycerol kinase family protein [Brevibacillus laterosporus]MCZ0833597.1 diacylglycerol kinase family protein [Brevibacillus halotolerans]